MKVLDTMYTDVTCCESEMCYPMDAKLLWKGIKIQFITFNMETKFLKYVHRLYINDRNDKSKYILEDSNWNDYGYYTRYGLYLPIKDNARLALAGLFILKYKLDIDEVHWFCEEHRNFTTFICNIESAYNLLLFLSPIERKELISRLNIQFDNRRVKNEQAYKISVLRDKSEEFFLSEQKEIEKIVTCPLDVAEAISMQKEKLRTYIQAGL